MGDSVAPSPVVRSVRMDAATPDALDARGPVLEGTGRFMPTDTTTLTADPEDTLTHLMRLTTGVLGVPIAYVALIDGARLVVVSQDGLPAAAAARGELEAARSLSGLAISRRQPVLASDAGSLDGMSEQGLFGDVVHAAMPLQMPDGELIGTLCAAANDHVWTTRDEEVLRHIAAAVTLVLRNREMIHGTDAMADLLHRMVEPIGDLGDHVRRLIALAADAGDARIRAAAALTEERIKAVDALIAKVRTAIPAARPRPGRGRTSVDVVELVRRSVASARAVIGSNDAYLHPPACEIVATCDPLELEQSVTSLLIALMQFAGPQDQVVHLRLVPTEKLTRLDVLKLGAPIPAAELSRMIGRFRLDAKRPMTSLGLVGDQVWISSGPVSARSSALGTAFRIILPLAP
jgi:GAF domain-containing protein